MHLPRILIIASAKKRASLSKFCRFLDALRKERLESNVVSNAVYALPPLLSRNVEL